MLLMLLPALAFGQARTTKTSDVKKATTSTAQANSETYVSEASQLTYQAAIELLYRARAKAATMQKEVSVAVVDASGETILLSRGDGVGPHNTEAARRKAYTALSIKTATPYTRP